MITSLSATAAQIIRNGGNKKLPKIQRIMSFVLFCGAVRPGSVELRPLKCTILTSRMIKYGALMVKHYEREKTAVVKNNPLTLPMFSP